ncbi:hypothetical protein L2E82_29999 [Cichorium intybus]|uniref:Uncharacterized protein n=1 Tax=Cichorium intybus TaxID=13427 RepID=A0ACB9CZ62_CICIN|nr:hypothetical protein L2E82_29999 [Cichorium intybus]
MTGINTIKPDHYSFTATLSACAGSFKLHYGQKIHAMIVSAGYSSSLPVNNSLIDMYAKCLNPCSAHDVFEEIEFKNNVSWCSLLFAYVHNNQFQFAQSVFDAMPNRVNIAWNTMIAGHAQHGNVKTCIDLFKKMMTESCDQDQWTFSSLMNAATEAQEYHIGCIPEDVLKIFESIQTLTQVSWNAIIDAQMKIGNTQNALIAFHNAPEKNVISWTSMISGYVRNGNAEEGIRFFVNMIRTNLLPDDFSLGTVLHACSLMATLGHGKMIHGLAIRHGFHSYAYVGNGLVNMYAKCGDINGSFQSFNDIIEKDLFQFVCDRGKLPPERRRLLVLVAMEDKEIASDRIKHRNIMDMLRDDQASGSKKNWKAFRAGIQPAQKSTSWTARLLPVETDPEKKDGDNPPDGKKKPAAEGDLHMSLMTLLSDHGFNYVAES